MVAGGKTASLKALGLMALMAKAGLFLPVAAAAPPAAGLLNQTPPDVSDQPANAGSSSNAPNQPSLLWFDKVLADVGDGQNLQQSLSTFSGHVRRLRGVLTTCTSQSLILLDEVCLLLCLLLPAVSCGGRGPGGVLCARSHNHSCTMYTPETCPSPLSPC